jgi:hypothetical protein
VTSMIARVRALTVMNEAANFGGLPVLDWPGGSAQAAFAVPNSSGRVKVPR